MKITDEPIVVIQTFEVSIDRLWNAITDPVQMKQWFFENIEVFEPKVGFETSFIVTNEGRLFPHLWRITAVEPPIKITYNWKYEGYTGNSVVTFDISKHKNGSKLMLTHEVTENFPQDIPEFRRESCKEGWDWLIKKSLKECLKDKVD